MWKSFVLELHGEWSEFAGECIGLWLLSPLSVEVAEELCRLKPPDFAGILRRW
jgi:hypothetical protein